MIVDFSVSNYRSIRDEQTLSMAAADKNHHDDFVFQPDPAQNIQLLKSCVIYGPNASGKSNVLRALRELASLVKYSSDLKVDDDMPTLDEFFKLDPVCKEKPITFEVEFFCDDNIRYKYYASVSTGKNVVEERLEYSPSSRSRLLYHRVHGEPIKYGEHFKGHKKSVEEQLGDNMLFLSKAANSNVKQLIPVYRFFSSKVHYKGDDSSYNPKYATSRMIVEEGSKIKNRVLNFLRSSDVGVSDISIDDVGIELEKQFPESLPEEVKKHFIELNRYQTSLGHVCKNKGASLFFPFEDESNGTQMLHNLAGMLFATLERGEVLVIDEIERSLHHEITARIFDLFNSPTTNPKGAQLIAATHDVTLLSPKNFRRDQIWFTEKDQGGGTQLYSMLEFKKSQVRKEGPWGQWYLDGRFDAVPVVDDDLLEQSFMPQSAQKDDSAEGSPDA